MGIPPGSAPTARSRHRSYSRAADLRQQRARDAKYRPAPRRPNLASRRFSSWVREAFVRSVAWTAPPVRFHSSQLSMLPAHSSPWPARSNPFACLLQDPADLAAREHRVDLQAGSLLQERARDPALLSWLQNGAVRRHCHTTHGPTGWPVARSHTRPSRADWRSRLPPDRVWIQPARHASIASRVLRHTSSASCSTQPGCGNLIVVGHARPRQRPHRKRPTTSAFVFVVP